MRRVSWWRMPVVTPWEFLTAVAATAALVFAVARMIP